MAEGLIPSGDIDTRSIEDVRPDELHGYTQCHFFAGIGGWPLALALAGWPSDRPVWTGSCPCQPFSKAGKGLGFEDERHLWPSWQHLVAQCGPSNIFGEQVASKAAGDWIDLVQADLEGMGYTFGCVPLPSAGVGAPHIRDRAYWVADMPSRGCGVVGWGRRVGAKDPWAYADEHHQGHPGAWARCRDGRVRPVEPNTFPLAYGIRARVGRLRAYGNAIVPQVAAEFIKSYVEASVYL